MQLAWDEIESIYALPHVDKDAVKAFKNLKKAQTSYTREEGNLTHYCSFFLPYDKKSRQIYLGNHIKAEGWIPPGGHIEPGETPSQAVIREMEEELRVKITRNMIEQFDLSVTIVGREKVGCYAHYDVWHLVHIPVTPFDYDRGEYYEAKWFSLAEGIAQMAKHPHFASIASKLA